MIKLSQGPYLKPNGNLQVTGQINAELQAVLLPVGITQTVNWNNGNVQRIDLSEATGDVTLSFKNPIAGATYLLKVTQAAAVARNIMYPASVKWVNGGIEPVITSSLKTIDILIFFYDGINYFSSFSQNYK